MKIGIPNALLHSYYGPFWESFFEELDFEVIVSEETNKRIINYGVKESVPEICVPIKIYLGHALDLLEKNVDYIFVPRMISIHKGEIFCPKFMGLPDMMNHGVKALEEKILSCHISSTNEDISDYKNYISMASKLGVSETKIKAAARIAGERWRLFRRYNRMGYTPIEASNFLKQGIEPKEIDRSKEEVQIGLLGYVYNMYDNFVSMDIVNKLRELNVGFITFDMIEEDELRKAIDYMKKPLFWTFSNMLLGAGYKLFRDYEVDGVIHTTAFGCGPDSFLGKLFEIESDETGIPFMTIRIDEHTGENHLQTRIEAFVDMLKRKKLKAV